MKSKHSREFSFIADISLRYRNAKTTYCDGDIITTTLRLLFISNQQGTPHKALQMNLSVLSELDTVRKPYFCTIVYFLLIILWIGLNRVL